MQMQWRRKAAVDVVEESERTTSLFGALKQINLIKTSHPPCQNLWKIDEKPPPRNRQPANNLAAADTASRPMTAADIAKQTQARAISLINYSAKSLSKIQTKPQNISALSDRRWWVNWKTQTSLWGKLWFWLPITYKAAYQLLHEPISGQANHQLLISHIKQIKKRDNWCIPLYINHSCHFNHDGFIIRYEYLPLHPAFYTSYWLARLLSNTHWRVRKRPVRDGLIVKLAKSNSGNKLPKINFYFIG